MGADALAVIFVLATGGLGWYRGALVQTVTIFAAVILLVMFDAWYPPVDAVLANIGSPLSENVYLRKMVGFLGAFFLLLITAAIFELAARRSGFLVDGNRKIGVALGALQGVAAVVLLAWFVETVTLWEKQPHELTPSWMRESVVMKTVSPWNPVRVYGLKDAIERGITKVDREKERREREAQRLAAKNGEALDPAAAAVTPDGEPAPQDPIDPVLLENDARVRALFKASPVRKLMDETASLSEWHGRGYGDLVRDPEVRKILRDADIADLLFGD